METAERLGLPAEVLNLAKTYLSSEHKIFEEVLQQLQSQLGTVEKARNEALALQEEAEKLKNEWQEKLQKTADESIEKARRN